MSADSEQTTDSSMSLRHTFVSMLFALAIAETAILTSDLLSIAAGFLQFDGSGKNSTQSFSQVSILASATHLSLAFVLISSSWVGWSKSVNKHELRRLDDIFSVSFVLLLIELLLVVLYFVLVRSVEISFLNGAEGAYQESIKSSSAAPEAFWLMIVYIGYVVWDVFSDVLPRYYPEDSKPFPQSPLFANLWVFITGFFTRCWVSILCAYAAYYVYSNAGESSTSESSAVWGDLALLCIVLWFWLAKVLEPWVIEHVAKWERNRKGGRNKSVTAWQSSGIVGLVLFFFLFVSWM